jgi:hypothetical protein
MDESGSWVAWAWWGGGWGLVALAAGVFLWAVFWDRARGRKRCPRCWYDMRGGGLACPECGTGLSSERELGRTRRRWRWAAAALIAALVGTQAADWPNRAGEDGWTRFVPSTVLVLLARREPQWAITRAIGKALEARPMASWQGAIVELRMLEVTDKVRAAVVTTRGVWPVGEPVVMKIGTAEGIGPRFEDGRLIVTDARGTRVMSTGLGAAGECGCCEDDIDEPEACLVLPGRGPGKYVEWVRVRLTSRGWTIAWWEASVAFEVKGTIDDLVQPVNDRIVTAAIRESLCVNENETYGSPEVAYWFWVAPELEGMGTMPLKGEVLVDGKVAGRFDGRRAGFWVVGEGSEEKGENVVHTDAADRVAFAREHVRVRITGDQRVALDEGAATAYWSGTIEVSVGELMDGK